MTRPPSLRPGDKAGIVATARRIHPEDVETAIKVFRSWGLEVVISPHLFSQDHSYLAGTDDQRTSALQQFLNDPSIKAVFCARGGYGTTRIIDALVFGEFLKSPKWVVGYSDITSLHLKLASLDVESIHGTMPIVFGKPDVGDSLESLRKALFEEPVELSAEPSAQNKTGSGQGKMVGGNLSLIADSLGTSYEPETKGCILVLEEIDEYLYRIDRMIVQLKRAGKLGSLAGLVVGHFTDLKDAESFGESFSEIIRYHTREYNYPIGFGFPTGHINPNHAWISGRRALLEVSEGGGSVKVER